MLDTFRCTSHLLGSRVFNAARSLGSPLTLQDIRLVNRGVRQANRFACCALLGRAMLVGRCCDNGPYSEVEWFDLETNREGNFEVMEAYLCQIDRKPSIT